MTAKPPHPPAPTHTPTLHTRAALTTRQYPPPPTLPHSYPRPSRPYLSSLQPDRTSFLTLSYELSPQPLPRSSS